MASIGFGSVDGDESPRRVRHRPEPVRHKRRNDGDEESAAKRYDQGPLFDGEPSLKWTDPTDLPPSMIGNIQKMLGGNSALMAVTRRMAELALTNPELQSVDTVKANRLPTRMDSRVADNSIRARVVETNMKHFGTAMRLVNRDYLETVIVDLSVTEPYDFGMPDGTEPFRLKSLVIRGFYPKYDVVERVSNVTKVTLPHKLTLDFPLYTSQLEDEEEATEDTIQHRTKQSQCVLSAFSQLRRPAAFCHAVRELDIPMLYHDGVLDRAAAFVRECVNLEVLHLGHVPGVPTTLIQAIAASKIKSLTMSTAGETYEFDPLYNHATLERVSFTYGYDDGSDGSVGSAFTSLIKAVKTMRNLTALELEYASRKRVNYYVPLLVPDYDTMWHERLVELRIRGQIRPSEVQEGSGIYTIHRHANYSALRTFECNVIDLLPGDDHRDIAVAFIKGVCQHAPLLAYVNVQTVRPDYQVTVYKSLERQDHSTTGIHLVADAPLSRLDNFPKSVTTLTLACRNWQIDAADVKQVFYSNVTTLFIPKAIFRVFRHAPERIKCRLMDEDTIYPSELFLSGRPIPTDDMDEESDDDDGDEEDEDDDD